MDKLEEYISYIDSVVVGHNYSRLGTVFETKRNSYFYDSGTGKVYECTKDEYEVFKYILENNKISGIDSIGLQKSCLLSVLEDIQNLVKQENILQMPMYTNFTPYLKETLQKKLNEEFKQLILEVTQNCNLRCGYCIYHDGNGTFRNFSNRSMTWETAKKAIDYAFQHSGDEIAITFYGGEPLVNYDLLKECIEYCRKQENGKRKITYSFTSNLTLMTKERAEYFASLGNCSIMGSIDGPEEIHNRFRKTKEQKGSFKKAIDGLRNLIIAYGENAEKMISINAVLAPPYSASLYEKVNNYFKDTEWLPNNIKVHCSYMDPDTYDVAFPNGIPAITNNESDTDYSISDWSIKEVLSSNETKLQQSIVEDNLLKIHKRFITDKPIPTMNRNACCIPGQRRLYVTTDGEYRICERVGKSPSLGNVDIGIDFDKLYESYIQSYEIKAVNKCSNCWCNHLCSMCYVSYCNENEIDFEKKFKDCDIEKEMCKRNLIRYHSILEENPKWLEHLNDIKQV
nr:radical SAM protein [uncultured Lachnoclostridium sp.]